MYEDLVKRLRNRANGSYEEKCEGCEFTEDFPPCVHCTIKAFNDAADAIEELSKPRWIPVTERMPTGGDDSGAICENVCLLLDDGTVSCGWMNGITKKVYYLNARDDVVIKAPITRVTHWMPLPQPPKEEK